jgi:two-component system sensor histidine kinase KdpD
VQHLESLRDVISRSRASPAETVPDSVFEEADEVELVDLPAEGLLERLREGKVYVPHQAERAIQNFFTKGNLIALRELALRKAADRVGAEMEDYREQHGVAAVWPVSERLLVCIGPSPFSARLVRATRRIAASLKAPWVGHVETPADARCRQDREQLSRTLNLVEQLGGETTTLSDTTCRRINPLRPKRNVTKIIVGKPTRRGGRSGFKVRWSTN